MRILYVALTRAQNHLILFGSASKNAPCRWEERAAAKPFPPQFARHQSWLDWLGTFAAAHFTGWASQAEGATDLFQFRFHAQPPALPPPPPPPRWGEAPAEPGVETLEPFAYEHLAATRQAAKTSVTALRQAAQSDDEAAPAPARFRGDHDGTERGRATHTFLEHFSFAAARDAALLRAEAGRLVRERFLTREQAGAIDLETVCEFWNSPGGREFLQHPQELRRELPFTFKAEGCRPGALAGLEAAGLLPLVSVPPGEFIVIQGVADLVRLAPGEVWLIDFKSDRIEPSSVPDAAQRYQPQILLYAAALGAIFQRPVTRKGIFFLHPRRFWWFAPVFSPEFRL